MKAIIGTKQPNKITEEYLHRIKVVSRKREIQMLQWEQKLNTTIGSAMPHLNYMNYLRETGEKYMKYRSRITWKDIFKYEMCLQIR